MYRVALALMLGRPVFLWLTCNSVASQDTWTTVQAWPQSFKRLLLPVFRAARANYVRLPATTGAKSARFPMPRRLFFWLLPSLPCS